MHRDWMDNPALDPSEPFDRRSAWAWLIEHAAYEPARVKSGSKIVALARGQLTCSLRYIAQAWKWGHERVRRFLARLQTEAMIETASGTGQLLITICNYDAYQSSKEPSRQQARQPARQARDSVETNIKEGKESKKDSDANASGADAPAIDPVKELWDRGIAIVGNKQRSLFAKMVRDYGKVAMLEAIVEVERENPVDRVSYLIACCKQRKADGRSQQGAYDILARAAIEHDERQGYRGRPETAH